MQARLPDVVILASTDDEAVAFGPYVPAMAEDGRVAFTARLRDGRSIVRVVGPPHGPLVTFDAPGLVCTSHPDLDGHGRVVVYAEDGAGGSCLVRFAPSGRVLSLAGPVEALAVGPLGPTVNRRGDIAFRARAADEDAVFVHDVDRGIRRLTLPGEAVAFHGLPVLDDEGVVHVRADVTGASVILRAREDGRTTPILTAPLGALGAFPSVDAEGVLVTRSGALVRVHPDGEITTLVGPPRFAHVRGALPRPSPSFPLFFATTRAAPDALAIFTGPDPAEDRVLGLGDALAGSRVAAFALNPVSVNARGEAAVRVALEDGRELVVRLGAPA